MAATVFGSRLGRRSGLRWWWWWLQLRLPQRRGQLLVLPMQLLLLSPQLHCKPGHLLEPVARLRHEPVHLLELGFGAAHDRVQARAGIGLVRHHLGQDSGCLILEAADDGPGLRPQPLRPAP